MEILAYYKSHKLMAGLLVAIPASILAGLFHADQVVVFFLSLVAFVPLANMIGISTEMLAEKTGPKLGGLVNATLGNLPELVVTLMALGAGLTTLVLGSIAGAFASNILFVLGFSMFMGGVKNGKQRFSLARANSKTLYIVLTSGILSMLAILEVLSPNITSEIRELDQVSVGLGVILLVLYSAYMIATFKEHAVDHVAEEDAGSTRVWPLTTTLFSLAAAAILVTFVSHYMVSAVESVTERLPISEAFIGFVIIPIVSNAAEHLVAVAVARKNRIALAVEISVGSALQVVGLMAPIIIFASQLMGHPIELVFSAPQLLAIVASGIMGVKVLGDGETTWEEGLGAIALFMGIALVFFFLY